MQSSHETDTPFEAAEPQRDAASAVSDEALQPPAPAAAGADGGDPLAELAQIEERYRRALADLDNYRKRFGRELERRVEEARESMLLDWLDVVDSVERAIRMQVDGACRDGLRALLAQMDDVLARHGVERIGRPGEIFDPRRHEAVATRPGEDVDAVAEVQRSGFARGERVIRPAQVVVARAGERSP